MTTSRRHFLDRLAVGAVAVGGLPLAFGATAGRLEAAAPSASASRSSDTWDTSWTRRLTGKHRTVFDVPEIESGYGVWRASVWARQYEDVLGVAPADMSTAVILRHNGIVLAMQQEYWDRYDPTQVHEVTHPLTLEPTKRNPVLLSAKDGVPAPYDSFALDRFMARGGVALACDLALQDLIAVIAKQDGLSAEAARERALGLMVPGVILQPSGVFSAVLAQEAGCSYVRAS